MRAKVDEDRAETGKRGEIIARNRPTRATWAAAAAMSHTFEEVRRCRSCGVRKVLKKGFYRHRTGRGGYRAQCKRCRNRQRARWARSCYVPKTGRRYLTKADRLAANGGGAAVEERARA